MEVGEENDGSLNLKRPRAPLSDCEDDALSPSGGNDGQKRRRLEAAGRENRSPRPSSSGRLAELDAKPDTPMVPSVRSRVQQLTQRREGGAPLAQRCLSDPGTNSQSLILHQKGLRGQILGQGEFHQRMERFKVPVFPGGPAPSPASASPRARSDAVSAIQQKLHGTPVPSAKQASRIRQEREEELSHLPFQPISENAWLKRSSSDSALSLQIDGGAEMKDGSFTDAASPSCAESQSSEGTGQRAPSDPEALVELNAGRKEQSPHRGDEVRKEEGDEERQPGTQRPQAVLKLSFSDDLNLSEPSTGDETSLLDSTLGEEAAEASVVTAEEREGSSCSEGGGEPSTDEESRSWRYPRGEEDSIVAGGQEEEGEGDSSRGRVVGHREPAGVQHEDVSETQEDVSETQEDRPRGAGDLEPREPRGGLPPGAGAAGEVTGTPNQEEEEEEPHPSDEVQSREEEEEEDMEVQSDGSGREKRAEASDGAPSSREVSDLLLEAEPDAVEESLAGGGGSREGGGQSRAGGGGPRDGARGAEGGERSKRVSFVLQPELMEDSRAESSESDGELSSHDETNTAEIIDQMFDEVLEYAGRMEEEDEDEEEEEEEERGADGEDHDSGIGVCPGDKDNKMDTEKGKSEEEAGSKEEGRGGGDEPGSAPCGALSPLSGAVEAGLTPLRLAASRESRPPSLLLTPEGTSPPHAESAPLYSVDAYRTQRQTHPRSIQSVTPGVQRRAPEKLRPPVDPKETIAALGEEAVKLQTVISQTLQALSCCTDEDHGRGSLEEAEAEKLLLVSCEKRSALLAEVARLRERRGAEPAEDGEDAVSPRPCRGTVRITGIQLPLKVEFVCSSHKRSGRPSHYFFVLIRYGPCTVVATPLATAADALNGDTVSFPTSVTLKDIRSSFEIDVEVYSLSHASASSCSVDRTTAKSRVTPRKLLSSITRSNHSLTSGAPPALNTRRSSNFFLVGSHKITLASLGLSRFPLDKMKLEGKIRRLLGDEFQDKVPFLSPLEGNIYLSLASERHSDVQHHGFLTMFELLGGFGVWHRRYFVLEGCSMFHWNHPNDRETKAAEGSLSLSSAHSRCVRPVKRDSCARPFTFELVSSASQDAAAKCWFSADTKQERLDWMERLNQALLDYNTWNQPEALQSSSTSSLRESIL